MTPWPVLIGLEMKIEIKSGGSEEEWRRCSRHELSREIGTAVSAKDARLTGTDSNASIEVI